MAEVYPPSEAIVARSYLKSAEERRALYEESVSDPNKFWDRVARENFHWEAFWDPQNVRSFNYDVRKGPIFTKWFEGGRTNVCYNALDRHVLNGKGDKIAYFWEGNEIGEESKITYKELLHEVCKFANVLKKHGVKVGTTVTVYMPMVMPLAVALLACARIGALLNVVFAGFSAPALAGRMVNCQSSVVVTADSVFRGSKPINLKAIVDEALDLCKADGLEVTKCIVYERHGRKVAFQEGRDVWYKDEMAGASDECPVEWMNAEDPLFLLYTSGSTGKPKGVVHTTGGYMVYASLTHKYIFDCQPDDVYWCTADVGWITGHSYVVFGPLLNNATSILFEGIPTHPDAGRCWQVVDKYNVTIFYTAPTAIRALQRLGNDVVKKYSRKSLRILGTVGEPINVEAWKWYHEVIGDSRCAIVDTWWQTETGGIMITPLPGSVPTKPGSATLPFFGVKPAIIDDQGVEQEGACTGYVVMKEPHPAICRTVYGDHPRYEQTYFQLYPGFYFTGDGGRRDEDGYYWFTGRVDDVLNVSGHRLGTAEIENALNTHPDVVESAVVGYPHEIKGVGIYAYVTLQEGLELTEDRKRGIKETVRALIGPIATPDILHWAPALPKTRSGKIMRRILRKIATNETDQLGDITTLADPSAVQKLLDTRGK